MRNTIPQLQAMPRPCAAAVMAAGAAGTVRVRRPASRVSTAYLDVRADAATRATRDILRVKRLHNRAVKLPHRLPIYRV